MFTMREIAATVRERRADRGWTQGELASHAAVSRSFVIDVEAGKPTVEAGKLFDVFQALDAEVALYDLATGEVRR